MKVDFNSAHDKESNVDVCRLDVIVLDEADKRHAINILTALLGNLKARKKKDFPSMYGIDFEQEHGELP